MTRQEMIDLLSNALSTAQVESQGVLDIEETDDSVSVLITPTGRLILTLLDPEVESVRAILSKGGGAEIASFVVDLLLDQIKCEWCPTNLEKPTQELVGRCELAGLAENHGIPDLLCENCGKPMSEHDMMAHCYPKSKRRWFGRTWWFLRG